MAAAASVSDDLKPVKRSSSFGLLPPSMSELRVVLLGNSWSQRSSVGNFILRETKFNTEEEPDDCQRERGQLKDKEIVLINTPDLLLPNISEHKLTEHVTNCVRLSDPGPHVFLLVLQPEDFTEEHKLRLCRVLELFSDQSFDHSLVLISTPREETPGFMNKGVSDQPLKDLIRICRYRYLKQENLERPELLTRLGQTAKESDGEHVSCEARDAGLIMTPKSEHIKPALNLVLCGRRGAGKTSAAKAILAQTEFHSVSNSSECVKHQREVCGRWVSLVELPALYGKPQEAVMEESLRCISLCDPEGVHVFILVLPVGPLTDEDKGELETIQNTFSSRVDDFTMILFTVESDPAAPADDNFVKENKDIQELCQSCGGRYVVLNIKDKQQIPELLDMVEQMRAEGSRCFTKDVFTRAQMEKAVEQENINTRLKAELQEVKKKSEKGKDDEDQSRECVRMVLVGKTGSGKSATGNTILGKEHFKSLQKTVPMSCEKATRETDGRPVAVVDTPSLFDKTLSEDEIQQELHKCFSMLNRKDEDIRRKHEEDLKTLKRKVNVQREETEQERKLRSKQLKDKDECINKERQERKEDRLRWKQKEETQRQEWRRKLEASEKIVKSEREQRENAERKLDLCRKENKRDREAWDKDRKDIWERVRQEDKQNLEELKTSYGKLQEEYNRKRRIWTYSLFVLLMFLLFLLCYVFLYSHSVETKEHT